MTTNKGSDGNSNNYINLLNEVEDYAIVILDPAGYIVDWNKGAQRIKGYTKHEIIGKNFRVFYTNEDQANGLPEKLIEVAKSKGKVYGEGWRVKKDASVFWGSILITALYDDQHNITGYGKITRDLTERKAAEEHLKNFNKELAEVIHVRTEKLQETTHIAETLDSTLKEKLREISDYKFALEESSIVAITDNRGVIKHVNHNFCKISRYSREELIGQDHRIVNSNYHGKGFMRQLWATIGKGDIWKGEIRNQAKDGTIYWVDTTIVPFIDEQGKPYQYLAIKADITQRKIEEEKTIAANRLYAFISQVNQTIVHVTDEQILFQTICDIAVKQGHYRMALVGILNYADNTNNLVAENGATPEELKLFAQIKLDENSDTIKVRDNNEYIVYNDITNSSIANKWQTYMLGRGFLSSCILPIEKFGKVVGTLNLFSELPDRFDYKEMSLLDEVAGDVSFAIENFENEKLKKEIEQQLFKSEKYMRSIVEKSGDGFILVDANMHVFYVAPNSEAILGYPPDEIAGHFRIELVREDFKDAIADTYQKALDNPHIAQGVEYMMMHKHGHYMWVEASFTCYLDDPIIQAMIINYRDITLRKVEQERTIAAKRLYHFISQVNQTIVHVKSQEKLFAKVCSTAVEYGNFSMSWIGVVTESQTVINMVSQSGANDKDLGVFKHLKVSSTWPISVVLGTNSNFICNDIEKVEGLEDWRNYALSRGFKSACILPIRKFGEIIGTFNLYAIVPNIFDVTEMVLLDEVVGDISFAVETFEKENHRSKIEEQLIKSDAILNKAQEIAHLGSYELNLATYNVTWSDEMFRIFGMEPQSLVPDINLFFSLLHPDDQDWMRQEYFSLQSEFKDVSNHYRIVRIDGTVRQVYSEARFEISPSGTPSEMYGIVHDVTEQVQTETNLKNSEAELRKLNMELEERVFLRTGELTDANQELEAFSYTVSHDLRTPIRAVQIFGNLLKNKFNKDTDQTTITYLDNILTCTIEMNDLINDLLEFSKLGRHELKKSFVDMDEMAHAVAASVIGIEESREIIMNIAPLDSIHADATLIRSIWLNLISNAVKYSKKDQPCQVNISSIQKGDSILYQVTDNGIGFDMKYYVRLFKPFSRLHTSTDYKGTGAGLAICDRIIKKHGGEIWAESIVDKGSTFYFSLPL